MNAVLSQTILRNGLKLLKWSILAVLAYGEFEISSKKSFITSTTGEIEKSVKRIKKD